MRGNPSTEAGRGTAGRYVELCALALRELLDFLLRHRLQPRQKGFYLPLRRVIGQDEFLRLRPDDVGCPVVQARRAPPGNGEPAERHTPAPPNFCQRLPARFHVAPLLARRLSVSRGDL